MKKSFRQILEGKHLEDLTSAWASTEASEEFEPLPPGEYLARIVSGGLFEAQTGTRGYKLTFRILEGEHEGRQVWHDIWLTPPAMGMAKRDLGKLGITDPAQLNEPLKPGFRCKVKVVLRREDDGTEYNRVRRFEVVGIDDVADDLFPPKPMTDDPDETEASHAPTEPTEPSLPGVVSEVAHGIA